MDRKTECNSDADEWRREWSRGPVAARIFFAAVLVIGTCGGLVGAEAVTTEFPQSWVAWLLALAVLEPVGLVCGFGLLVLVFPRSAIARWFASSLKRARMASLLVGLVFAGAILWVVVFLIYALWKTHS
jgi:hypothetical protein